jgi:transposase
MDADPREQEIQRLLELARQQAQTIAAQSQKIEAQAKRIAELEERLEKLEREAHRSAAPFRRQEKDRKPPGEHKKPGRQKGHEGAYRKAPDRVDEEVDVPLERCPGCGGPVHDVRPCVQHIQEIPPVTPRVTRLTTYTGKCARCGKVRTTHPVQVSVARGSAGTHLGARALSLAAWLNKSLGLTLRKAARLLRTMFGLIITPGGLTGALERVAERSRPLADELAAGLRDQPAVYADETGWWLENRQAWLWVFTTPERTVYLIEDGRGREVVERMLGPGFEGVLVSDCLAAYEKLLYRTHKCHGHHLVALKRARRDAGEEGRRRIDEVVDWIKGILQLTRVRRSIPPPMLEQGLTHQRSEMNRLLDPPGPDATTEKVMNRLRKRKASLLTCLEVEGVDATNNRAERQLRPAVITRKLSWGHKSRAGADAWQILASLAATADQRGQDFIELVLPRLRLEGR